MNNPALFALALTRWPLAVALLGEVDDLGLQLHDPLIGRIVVGDRLVLAAGGLGHGRLPVGPGHILMPRPVAMSDTLERLVLNFFAISDCFMPEAMAALIFSTFAGRRRMVTSSKMV